MKHFMKCAVMLLVCVGILFSAATGLVGYVNAAWGTCGPNLSWSFDPSTGHLSISGYGIMEERTPWKEDYASQIRSVSIAYGAENISKEAFYACANLQSISIPNSVKEIGAYAFINTGLKSVRIPDSVEVIGANAFNSCDELTTVTMSSNLKRLGEYAFASCPKLTQISLPGTLDMVPSHCFAYDTLLKNVILGEGIREIADNAFFLCGAEMVRLPNSLKKIHAYGFKASNIREITIPTGITEIYEHTFDGCSKLRSVTLPYSIKQIHYHAFFSCEALERVVLPGYLSSIHSDAFLGCESLEYIVALNRNTVFTNRITNMYQTIVGYENSTAQEYAQTYGNKFLPISFYDVMPWEWYYDAVQYAADNSLMYGVNTAQFDPEGLTNRAMLVTVLWRYAGEAKEGENQFTDVEASQWYADAVAWASYHGIVSGMGDNRFAPEDTITREQMTAILFRYCNGLGIDTTKRASLQDFPDANKVSTWAEDAISWAVAEGIISGSKEGEHTYLNPDGGTTRAQMASILMRFIQNVLPQ